MQIFGPKMGLGGGPKACHAMRLIVSTWYQQFVFLVFSQEGNNKCNNNVANIDIDLICQPKRPNWPTVPPPPCWAKSPSFSESYFWWHPLLHELPLGEGDVEWSCFGQLILSPWSQVLEATSLKGHFLPPPSTLWYSIDGKKILTFNIGPFPLRWGS